MAIRAKDYYEPDPEEGPKPGSRWGLVFDGASNAYGHGVEAIIITPRGSHIRFTARLCFNCTNNMAEYETCIIGLEEAINLGIKILNVFGDSILVIKQIKGEWETRYPSLIPYKDYARRLFPFFDKVNFHHIPREDNQMTDALATLSSMYWVNFHNEAPQIRIKRLDMPANMFTVEVEVDNKPWYHDIKYFLQNQEYPVGASGKDN
ncbi:uncharacterized protein LOC127095968 [Lathyrus oleraceus]|uniref:uncharacterized protein LOC127095968 n=1 Tax=Pisum sativum TaxID=3888 RepID=UPI0021CE6A18|nr:uncharacterized protein LOC127095968 [Pisum sativum]